MKTIVLTGSYLRLPAKIAKKNYLIIMLNTTTQHCQRKYESLQTLFHYCAQVLTNQITEKAISKNIPDRGTWRPGRCT